MNCYMIRLPNSEGDAVFSRGGQLVSWALQEKGKRWRTLGHIKTHLRGLRRPYPPGTQVVCYTITEAEDGNILVSELGAR